MNILALDSSTSVTSVAFVSMGETPETLFSINTPHKRSDSSAIFEGLQSAIAACGHPDALCVGLGPGSYNGLRAGIAASRALATAPDIPLFAIASPLGLRPPSLSSDFWAVGDARGGHYWIAHVTEGTFIQAPILLPPDQIMVTLASHPELPILGSTPLPEIQNLVISTPNAGLLAILAKKVDPCVGTPEPLYLKPPHITAPRPVSARP